MSASLTLGAHSPGQLLVRNACIAAETDARSSVFTQTFWFAFAGLLLGTFLSEHNLRFSQMEDFAHGEDQLVAGIGGGNIVRRLSFFVVGGVGLCLLALSAKIPWKINPLLAGIYVLPFLLACVSFLWSIDPSMCLRRLIVRSCCALAALGMGRLFTMRQICWLAVLVMGSCIGIGVLTEIGLGTFRPWSANYRFSGTQHPNPQGMYLAGCCFASLALAWSEKKYRLYLIPLAAACLILLLLTKSRSATAALVITTGAVLLLQTTLRFKLFAGMSAAWCLGVIVLFVWLAQIDALRQLGEAALMGRKEESDTLSGRNFIWPLAQHFISQRPWLGHGFESFWTADHVQFIADELQFPVVEAHNGYLEVMLSTGRVGLGLHLLAVVVGIIAAARRLWQTNDPSCSFVTAVLTYSLLSACFESTMFGIFFVTLSAWAGVAHLAFGGAEETTRYAHS
jgi:exopolysaccharide production protein ExoQ